MVFLFLDEFVPIGGLFGDEVAAVEIAVDTQASPGVDCGIALLGIGQLRGFPVGELLSFADFLLEQDGIDFLKAHVGDVILFHELLQLDKSFWMYVAYPCKLVEVVCRGQSHFSADRVFKELLEWGGDAGLVQAEQECVVLG